MNVFDFDKTIYKHDSTAQFYYWLITKHPITLKYLPRFIFKFLNYKIGIMDKTIAKQAFFQFVRMFKDDELEILVNKFWDINEKHIFQWYKDIHREDDLVISASPRFIVEPMTKRLGISNLMCSEVDAHTGMYSGVNCYGAAKVDRYKEVYGDTKIDNFYSDSISDLPLAKLANKAFLVKKDGILVDWKI